MNRPSRGSVQHYMENASAKIDPEDEEDQRREDVERKKSTSLLYRKSEDRVAVKKATTGTHESRNSRTSSFDRVPSVEEEVVQRKNLTGRRLSYTRSRDTDGSGEQFSVRPRRRASIDNWNLLKKIITKFIPKLCFCINKISSKLHFFS